jgi:hypothetical protein
MAVGNGVAVAVAVGNGVAVGVGVGGGGMTDATGISFNPRVAVTSEAKTHAGWPR